MNLIIFLECFFFVDLFLGISGVDVMLESLVDVQQCSGYSLFLTGILLMHARVIINHFVELVNC